MSPIMIVSLGSKVRTRPDGSVGKSLSTFCHRTSSVPSRSTPGLFEATASEPARGSGRSVLSPGLFLDLPAAGYHLFRLA